MNSKRMIVVAVMMSLSTFVSAGCTTTATANENRMLNSNFYGVILKTNALVILNQGTESSVRIEGDQASVSSVETSVENGALMITGKNDLPVTIYVTVDDINLIEVSGNGKIFSTHPVYSDMLLLKVVGSGIINVDVRSLSLGMIVKGNGKIVATGSTGDSYIRVFGDGQVKSSNLDSFRTSAESNADTGFTKRTVANSGKHGMLKLHQ